MATTSAPRLQENKMGTIFTEILNLSVIASFLIFAVFLLILMVIENHPQHNTRLRIKYGDMSNV